MLLKANLIFLLWIVTNNVVTSFGIQTVCIPRVILELYLYGENFAQESVQ